MTLSSKVAELIEQLEADNLNDLVWRGPINEIEWKILIHRELQNISIVIKRRGGTE